MNSPSTPTRTRNPYFWPIIVVAVALVLIIGIVVLSSGSDDPLVKDATEPIAAAQTGATGEAEPTVIDEEHGEIPATEGAIDGKGVTASPEALPPSTGEDHHDDHAHGSAAPEDEATDAGPYVETATEFAQLNINRSTDEAESVGLNKRLVELAAGQLAVDLNNTTGEIATSQVPSTGEILRAIPLVKTPRYAEVLIVTKESIVDPATEMTLDPKYLTYLVRLDRIGHRGFAVTSWEPQL